MNGFTHGFVLMGGLIVAIGAQNAHVIKMGARGQHVLLTILICIGSDMLLTGFGICGMGQILDRWPQAIQLATLSGAAFLFWYALCSLRAVFSARQMSVTEVQERMSVRRAALLILAFTYLNPHVYLDTLVLVGSLGARLPAAQRWLFWAGCTSASALWFLCLGYAARWLRPLLTQPRAWRILDALIGVGMGILAIDLLR